MGGFGATEREQHDAHGRHDPQRDGHGGGHRSGIGSNAVPAHPPDRLRDPREPCRYRAPGHLPALLHRILSGGGAAAQDLLPQFTGKRGQRQQAEKRRRAQRARSVSGADLALLDVPANEVARLLGQLPIPVGQQLPEYRAGLAPGAHDEQCPEGFLQPRAGTGGQGVRAARRHAECLGEIGAIQVVPQAQLDDLTLTRPHLGQDGTGHSPEFGLRGVAADPSRRVRVDLSAADPHRGAEQTLAFGAGHRVQPRAQFGGLGKVAQRGCGDDERVLQGLGCAGRVVQHPMAVAVQGSRVPVVRQGDARRVSRRDRRGNLAVYGWPVVRPARG